MYIPIISLMQKNNTITVYKETTAVLLRNSEAGSIKTGKTQTLIHSSKTY